jgi:FtsP/CotA-like multicopper oxidase with cupredoxin domain
MVPPFDIFRVETDGHLAWKDTAETLDLARLRIRILAVAEPGDYVIYSQETGHKTVVRSDGSTVGPAVASDEA